MCENKFTSRHNKIMKCYRNSNFRVNKNHTYEKIIRIDESQKERHCVQCQKVIKINDPYFNVTTVKDFYPRFIGGTKSYCVQCKIDEYSKIELGKRV